MSPLKNEDFFDISCRMDYCRWAMGYGLSAIWLWTSYGLWAWRMSIAHSAYMVCMAQTDMKNAASSHTNIKQVFQVLHPLPHFFLRLPHWDPCSWWNKFLSLSLFLLFFFFSFDMYRSVTRMMAAQQFPARSSHLWARWPARVLCTHGNGIHRIQPWGPTNTAVGVVVLT